jgi:asparagine synthase (glutamine-hydrolysing)
VAHTGEVYNYRELRRELRDRGHRFRTSGDTEVVLHAYLEWGEEFAERLRGMFAFALWDANDRQLLLVRDRLGARPLHLQPLESGALFGSEPKAVLAHPAAERVVTTDGLRELLSGARTPRAQIYRGMREVEPGEIVRIGPEGISTRRYWRLDAAEHVDDLGTTVETVRDLLEDAVAEQLVADVPRCSLLTGDLDSAAITALAARALGEHGAGPVTALSPEGADAGGIAARVGADHDTVRPSQQDPDAQRRAVLHAYDLPVAPHGSGGAHALLAALGQRSTVALSDAAADDVFAGHDWFRDDEALGAGTFPWLAGARSSPAGLLDPDLRDQLDLPGYRRQRYREALREVPRLDGEARDEQRVRAASYLALTRRVREQLDRAARLGAATGVEVRAPLCDHRLVEYVFNVPWSMKAFDGAPKSLLRAAAGDLVPPAAEEPERSTDTRCDPGLLRCLNAVLDDPNSPVAALLDSGRTRELVRTGEGDRRDAEQVLQLDAWLRDYGVHLDL